MSSGNYGGLNLMRLRIGSVIVHYIKMEDNIKVIKTTSENDDFIKVSIGTRSKFMGTVSGADF
jgi:hypothetical protein